MAYDPMAAEVLDDPFPSYAALRRECPVHHHAGFNPPFFTVSRHADVVGVLNDVQTWSSRYGPSPQYTRPSGLVNDPPEHTEFRRLFVKGFTPRTVGGLEDEIEAIANELLDAVAAQRAGDFHRMFAYPLPMTVIARLLGVPESDLPLFKELCDGLTATYNLPDPRASGPARLRLDTYLQGHIDERRRLLAAAGVTDPGEDHLGTVVPNDMISGFVVAEYQGRRLTDVEMQWALLLLLLGGNETSTALLTNLVWRLLEDRTRWEALLADRALIDVAIEESLRHDPPVLGLFRTPARFDCDNHYYEALDAFTRHLDPKLAPRCVQWCEIDGRKYHVVGGKVSHAVVNPTFDPVAKPGALHDYFRGNPDGRPARVPEGPRADPGAYRTATPVSRHRRAGPVVDLAVPDPRDPLRRAPQARPRGRQATLFRAFNRWVDEDWGFNYQDRIFAAPYISLCDVDWAVEELEWALDRAPAPCDAPAARLDRGRPPLAGRPDVRPLLGPGERGRASRRGPRRRQRATHPGLRRRRLRPPSAGGG
jgi:cytochrome P450